MASGSGPSTAHPRERLGLLGFGLVSLSLLLLQIVLSRLFASMLTYYYAFMLISLAMLGLAAGGLLVFLRPALFDGDMAWRRAGIFSLATGGSILAGTLAGLQLLGGVSFDASGFYIANPWALAAVFWCFFPPFLLGGVVVSGVLSARRAEFHRFYAVDLAFAAAGCVLALLALGGSTPVEVLLEIAAVLPLVAAVLFALAAGTTRHALGALAVTALAALLGRTLAADPARAKPPHLAWAGRPEVVSAWNASSAVRVYPRRFFSWALSPVYAGPAFQMLELIIDGIGGTPIVAFDGKPESLAAYSYLDADLTALPHHLLPASGRQLIIGPGGGVDILQAERAGRRDITAVEINPLIVRVVNEDLADFSGSPYRLPGVRLFLENGRTFIKRVQERWDLLTLTWVDSGGSATALAFSENYLYTIEAFSEYLDRLEPGGMVAFLRAWDSGVVVDSMRGVSVAVEALSRRGASDPSRHVLIAVAKGPWFQRAMCLVLIRRTPFLPEQVAIARGFLAERRFVPIWLPDGSVTEADILPSLLPVAKAVRAILTERDRPALYRRSAFDIAPSTDDNPFYFVERAGPNRAAGLGVRQISLYVLILASLVVPFLLVPMIPRLRRGQPLGSRGWLALAYFALLGCSFMLVEIELFHVFAILLGKPTLTLAVVLASLLVASGCGSLLGEWLAERRSRLGAAFAALAALLALFVTLAPLWMAVLVGESLLIRIAGTLATVAPVGFCMGMAMPAGMHLIRDRRDLVLWGWTINGALSVFASLAAIYFAIHFGIAATFALGLAGYVCAGGIALRLRSLAPTA